MATAAYASVVSLMHVLDQIQHPARRHLHLNTRQIETLHEKVPFLQEFLELHSPTKLKKVEDLVKQIADVAIEAEDVIESIVVDRIRDGFKDKSDMDISRSGSSKNPPSGQETIVGFDEHLVRIMNELTGYQSKLLIIPIVGMGGIGKTTLARYAFDNPYIANHFDIRAWSIISQEYSEKEILRNILNDIGVIGDLSEDLAELRELLYKTLFCRRYLIVMDDVWNTKVWDDLKFLLPDNGNGSRIMITTRLSDVAISLGSHTPYLMNLLDEDKSWDLLCEKAFGQKTYSPELEEIGKEIAKSCRGLPLAIVVIGDLLATSDMTREYWEFVEENVNSLASSGNDEHCLKILSLSYNHLPIHLKPCFLSMGVFLQPTKLRYLSFAWIGLELLSPSITLLWNLQTLIMDIPFEYAIVLPSEIWEMSQLRHIIVQHRALLPYPVVTQIDRTYFPILDNLQTLSTIIDFRCTKDVLERIPNLKKLGIRYYNDFKDMTYVGSLPNLEVLEIDDAFKGPEWNPIEGEFLRLKVLLIYYTDLACWRAENSHFPILESLELNGVNSLEEIPPGIGEIVTLRSIHLDNCRECIVNSAKQILDEQQCIGN
ncbi:hypothetical protein BUALT_BualtUnG0060200 [Buddleja alternifolia]|uniref:NB-ARC domain-containing protein n=1 Tax=Buddleja alternifolia TaxID=168488 RepID=A0AAV6W0Q3_9LAMI|nr:hypothetical protein BUALT_BualtUnG0060200 [Buddleja alternifolia]